MSKSFLCVQDFCPCTAFVNFLETSCYSWKPPGNGLNFTSLETVLQTKSFLGNCLVHWTLPNSVQLGNLVLFGCVWTYKVHNQAKYQRLNANTLYVAAILFSRSTLHRESLPCLPNIIRYQYEQLSNSFSIFFFF